MKTSRPLSSGRFNSVYKTYPPVALLILGVCFSLSSRAQVHSYRFTYSENAITDYSSLISAGAVRQIRKDSFFHKGTMHVIPLSDSVWQVKLLTDRFSSTIQEIRMPAAIDFYAYTDRQYRVYKIATSGNSKVFLSVLQVWLGELHFKFPAAGTGIVEYKADGDLRVDYVYNNYDKDVSRLSKSTPLYLTKASNKQALVIDSYQWNGSFNRQTGEPNAIDFTEQKRQVLGRKVVACIGRRLSITGIEKQEQSWEPINTSTYPPIPLYPRLSDKERREKLAISLLGQESMATVKEKLQKAESLTNEGQFRLKSMVRSLLVLDSAAITIFINLLASASPGSAAFDIIENAMIESKIAAASDYVVDVLKKNEGNYERLKELLIKISLADAFTRPIALQLVEVLKRTKDADTKSMVSLALSNYAQSIHDDRVFYGEITQLILQPYMPVITDTLQYIYLAGNAGIEKETMQLMKIARNSEYGPEAYYALRNIHNRIADSAVHAYLLGYHGNEDVFGVLLAKRRIQDGFLDRLATNIIDADAKKDSTLMPALRYLLDNAWQRRMNIDSLLSHRFQMDVYRREIDDFRKQSALCRSLASSG